MHPLFKYLFVYMLLGAIGMYLGSRKQEKSIRTERWVKYIVYVLITALLIASILLNLFKYVMPVILAVCAVELVLAGRGSSSLQVTTRLIAYILFLIMAFGCINFPGSFERDFLLFIYFQVFIFDAFSQVTGQLFGKHKLFPAISPSKTVEGLIGGSVFCFIAALLGSSWAGVSSNSSLAFGCLTIASCFSGDMFASWYKRLSGIKDYSRLLPGQGGFLDRFDSLIMTGAVYFFIFGSYGK